MSTMSKVGIASTSQSKGDEDYGSGSNGNGEAESALTLGEGEQLGAPLLALDPTGQDSDLIVVGSGSQQVGECMEGVTSSPRSLPSILSVSLVEEVQQTLFEAFAPIARVHKALVILRWFELPEACAELMEFIIHYVPEYCKTKGAYDLDGHYKKTVDYMSSHPAFKDILTQHNAVVLKDLIRPLLLACAVQLLSYFVKDDDPRYVTLVLYTNISLCRFVHYSPIQ